MKEFKGTKGDWATGLFPNLNHPHRTILTTDNGTEICTIHLDNIEVRANAKLIAAAPELLEALQKAKKNIEAAHKIIESTSVLCSKGIFEIIDKAINKALN
jgi:hypothetical protein